MIYSRSAEYAIRALTRLAELPPGQFVMAKDIAAETGIPAHFLAKVLQDLVRSGTLRSNKGPTGGFTLRMPPGKISLLSIVETVDGLQRYRRCMSGLDECNDQMPCPMHDSWKTLRSRIMDYLERTSIADLARALDEKRRLLKKQRRNRSRK